MLENFRLGEWPFNGFLETIFDLVKSADFIPSDFWNFDIDFSQSRWLDVLDCISEIIHPDFHLFQDLWRDCFLIEVNLRQVSAKSLHGSFSDECSKVSTDEPVGVVEDPIDLKVISNRHLTGVNFHDFLSSFTVRNADLDFSVKTSTTTECWVEGVTSVGCTDNDNVVPSLHTIEECQHLSNNTALNFAADIFTLWTNGINFVNENNGGCLFTCFVENFTQLFF